jgi:SAM-dependent methyltransferase
MCPIHALGPANPAAGSGRDALTTRLAAVWRHSVAERMRSALRSGRNRELLRHIGPGARGIEVAPWLNPIIPPGGERSVVVLDRLDRPALLARAEQIPSIDKAMIPRIADVDLVGSASEIAELTRARFGPEARFDFVVSSHNLEHLPDPVRFLRGCEVLLTAGGIVAMAVPDKRACFDFFRPPSSTAEMLQAFHERRERPSFAQTFSQDAYSAVLRRGNGEGQPFTIDEHPGRIALGGDLAKAYSEWLGRIEAGATEYRDTHCWTFTPSSLELILTELILLGLINFEIVSVTRTLGVEFIVHLRKRPQHVPAQSGLAERRELLLRRTVYELGGNARSALGLGLRRWLRRLRYVRRIVDGGDRLLRLRRLPRRLRNSRLYGQLAGRG